MVYGLGSVGMKPQVLILEDNNLLAENLADLVKADLGGEALITPSVEDAVKLIPDHIVLAYLDIEVLDGLSYPAAKKLMEHNIPIIFVSGSDQRILPIEFQKIPFLSKPTSMTKLVQLSKSLSKAFH
ncbi:MAG TPA: hypothetical protein VF224_05025 [Aestuariivirga sp.]